MKLTDVKELTQKAIAQIMGGEYMTKVGDISALDDYKLVDVGRDVLESGSVEPFTKTLVSLIYKMEIMSDRYVKRLKGLFVNSAEWGGYLERVYFDLCDVLDDSMYNLVNGQDYSNVEHKFYKPKTSAKIYEEGKAIMIPISIATDQLKEGFNGWDNLNKYLSGIRQMVRNTLEITLDAYAHMLVSCGIAISDKATNNAVHLMAEAKANGIIAAETTVDDALHNKDFLTYCVKRMNDVRAYMQTLNETFNNGSIPTTASDTNMIVLHDFASAIDYFVKPTNYMQNISLGEFETVVCWQGNKSEANSFKFADLSKIMISADADNKLGIGTEAVTIENAVALIHDTRALGISPYKEKLTSSYTASADFWNEFLHVLVNYIIDANLSMVAFILD